jgi:tetratricopeptide (TPR) repeat protein
MKTYYTILILFLLQIGNAYSQNPSKDNLYSLLKNAVDDSSRYKIQMLLTDFYIEKDRDSSVYFSNACIDLASRNQKFLDVAAALSDKGHALTHLQKLSEAYTCFMDALKIANDPTFNGRTWKNKNNSTTDKERLVVLVKVYEGFANLMVY